eukprot:3879562-Rhodomonas_salina.2
MAALGCALTIVTRCLLCIASLRELSACHSYPTPSYPSTCAVCAEEERREATLSLPTALTLALAKHEESEENRKRGGRRRPVVVLAGAVDVREGLLLHEAREAVPRRNLLAQLHHHDVLPDTHTHTHHVSIKTMATHNPHNHTTSCIKHTHTTTPRLASNMCLRESSIKLVHVQECRQSRRRAPSRTGSAQPVGRVVPETSANRVD